MDTAERLTPQDLGDPTILTAQHLQRYRWAAELCEGLRVLDLCSGTGYGSAMLAERATAVVGVDNAADAIATSQAAYGHLRGLRFEQADAHEVLARDLVTDFDAIVIFEGLEHLRDLQRAEEALARHVQAGVRVLASVPNSRIMEEDNEFHVTDFDVVKARRLAEALDARLLLQVVAEGTLLCSDPVQAPRSHALVWETRAESEYAANYVLAAGVAETALEQSSSHLELTAAPVHLRWLRSLDRANQEFWRVNERLGGDLAELAQLVPHASAAQQEHLGAVPAAALSAKVERTLTALAEENAQRISRLEAELAEAQGRLRAEAARADEQAQATDIAERRLQTLRRRKVVRLGLALADVPRLRRR